jgi:hypothetical protein
MVAEPPNGYGFGDLMKPLFGTCLISAFTFAVLAYLDKTWRSSDAAGVIIGAGMAVYIGLSFQYDRRCQYFVAVLLTLVPSILCAQLAHIIGTLCRPRKHNDMKINLPSLTRLRQAVRRFAATREALTVLLKALRRRRECDAASNT